MDRQRTVVQLRRWRTPALALTTVAAVGGGLLLMQAWTPRNWMAKPRQGTDPRSASAAIASPSAGSTSQPVGDRTQIAVDTTSATPSTARA